MLTGVVRSTLYLWNLGGAIAILLVGSTIDSPGNGSWQDWWHRMDSTYASAIEIPFISQVMVTHMNTCLHAIQSCVRSDHDLRSAMKSTIRFHQSLWQIAWAMSTMPKLQVVVHNTYRPRLSRWFNSSLLQWHKFTSHRPQSTHLLETASSLSQLLAVAIRKHLHNAAQPIMMCLCACTHTCHAIADVTLSMSDAITLSGVILPWTCTARTLPASRLQNQLSPFANTAVHD